MWEVGNYGLKSLTVDVFQLLQRLISIRKWLKISQILVCSTIPLLVKLYAFLNLLLDGLLWPTIRGVESFVAAKGTASRADFPIPIGTAESCIDADFLHPSTELLREIATIAIESSFITPRE
jgi:hypothetical protein